MKAFKTVREAKEYLAGKIAEEAKSAGSPLNEVERKVLYFSETAWTLPDMVEVNAEFDRDYNQDEYEQKIGGLVRRIQDRQNSADDGQREDWCSAIERLRVEDDYLLVLIDAGCSPESTKPSGSGRLGLWLPTSESSGKRPAGDLGRLILAAIAGSALMVLGILLKDYLRDRVHF